MSAPPANRPESHPGESDLSRTYILVLVFEALVISGLYWLGRHFG
jgi:hypothetical protein